MTSASKEPVQLQVTGNVVPRQKTLDELYPFDMGGGVRFDSNMRAFAYVGRGDTADAVIGWVNTSDKPVRLALRWQQRSGLLTGRGARGAGCRGRGELKLHYGAGAERPLRHADGCCWRWISTVCAHDAQRKCHCGRPLRRCGGRYGVARYGVVEKVY